MARMYEMNLVIRLQDRASARMRRISGDMSALARHAQSQNKLMQMRGASQAAQVKQGKAIVALNDLENASSAKSLQNARAKKQALAQILTAEQNLAKTGITSLERQAWLRGENLRLTGKQHVAMLQLDAAQISQASTLVKINEEEALFVRQLGAATIEARALNAEIARQAPLIARSEAAAQSYRRGRTIAHAGSLSFMGGAVTVGLAGLAAASFAKFNVQATKAATQVTDTDFISITKAIQQTTEAASQLQTELLDMAKRWPASAESMAAASYNIFSSMDLGASAAERLRNGMIVLEEANKAAVGGQVDLAVATDTLITVFNDFLPSTTNLSTALGKGQLHGAMSQLFAIVRFMRGGFEELSAGMNKLAPSAKQAGQTLLQTGAAFAVVTQSIPSAAQSSTALARLMDLFGTRDFIAGMKRAGEAITEIDPKTGVEKLIPLYDILERIIALDPKLQFGGPKLSQLVKQLTQFGSLTGKGGSKGLIQMQRALTFLIMKHQEHANILKQATQDATEYDKSVQALAQTADVKWKTAMNNLKVAWIEFGQAAMPIMLMLLETFQSALNAFNRLSDGTKTALGKLVVVFGLVATAAGLFGSAFGGIMMVNATRQLWKIEEALKAVAVAEGEVAAASIPAQGGILGLGKKFAKLGGWVLLVIGAFKSLKGYMNGMTEASGNPAQRFARGWMRSLQGVEGAVLGTFDSLTKLAGIDLGTKALLDDTFNDFLNDFPGIFGKKKIKIDVDLGSLTASQQQQAIDFEAQGGQSKLDQIIKINEEWLNSEKELASWQAKLAKATTKAKQDALKQQKADVDAAAKNLLAKYRELEAANKAAIGSILSGPISGGPILGAFKQINDTLMGLGIKPIKVPLQFIMQDATQQLANFDLWRGGLKTLAKKIPPEMLQELQAAGIEKLPEILSLADAGPAFLKEYVGVWQKTKSARDAATKADMDSTLALWNSYGKDVAWQIVQGLISSGAEAKLLEGFTKTITSTFAGQLTKSMNDAVAQAIRDWKESNPQPVVTAPATLAQTNWALKEQTRLNQRTWALNNPSIDAATYEANQRANKWAKNNPNLARRADDVATNTQKAEAANPRSGDPAYTRPQDVPKGAKIKTGVGGKKWWWNGHKWIPIRKPRSGEVGSGNFNFASGGIIPGSGRGDTVPAMLTPGEVVLNKRHIKNASQMLGTANHPQAVFNKVQRFEKGGVVAAKNYLGMKDIKFIKSDDGTISVMHVKDRNWTRYRKYSPGQPGYDLLGTQGLHLTPEQLHPGKSKGFSFGDLGHGIAGLAGKAKRYGTGDLLHDVKSAAISSVKKQKHYGVGDTLRDLDAVIYGATGAHAKSIGKAYVPWVKQSAKQQAEIARVGEGAMFMGLPILGSGLASGMAQSGFMSYSMRASALSYKSATKVAARNAARRANAIHKGMPGSIGQNAFGITPHPFGKVLKTDAEEAARASHQANMLAWRKEYDGLQEKYGDYGTGLTEAEQAANRARRAELTAQMKSATAAGSAPQKVKVPQLAQVDLDAKLFDDPTSTLTLREVDARRAAYKARKAAGTTKKLTAKQARAQSLANAKDRMRAWKTSHAAVVEKNEAIIAQQLEDVQVNLESLANLASGTSRTLTNLGYKSNLDNIIEQAATTGSNLDDLKNLGRLMRLVAEAPDSLMPNLEAGFRPGSSAAAQKVLRKFVGRPDKFKFDKGLDEVIASGLPLTYSGHGTVLIDKLWKSLEPERFIPEVGVNKGGIIANAQRRIMLSEFSKPRVRVHPMKGKKLRPKVEKKDLPKDSAATYAARRKAMEKKLSGGGGGGGSGFANMPGMRFAADTGAGSGGHIDKFANLANMTGMERWRLAESLTPAERKILLRKSAELAAEKGYNDEAKLSLRRISGPQPGDKLSGSWSNKDFVTMQQLNFRDSLREVDSALGRDGKPIKGAKLKAAKGRGIYSETDVAEYFKMLGQHDKKLRSTERHWEAKGLIAGRHSGDAPMVLDASIDTSKLRGEWANLLDKQFASGLITADERRRQLLVYVEQRRRQDFALQASNVPGAERRGFRRAFDRGARHSSRLNEELGFTPFMRELGDGHEITYFDDATMEAMRVDLENPPPMPEWIKREIYLKGLLSGRNSASKFPEMYPAVPYKFSEGMHSKYKEGNKIVRGKYGTGLGDYGEHEWGTNQHYQQFYEELHPTGLGRGVPMDFISQRIHQNAFNRGLSQSIVRNNRIAEKNLPEPTSSEMAFEAMREEHGPVWEDGSVVDYGNKLYSGNAAHRLMLGRVRALQHQLGEASQHYSAAELKDKYGEFTQLADRLENDYGFIIRPPVGHEISPSGHAWDSPVRAQTRMMKQESWEVRHHKAKGLVSGRAAYAGLLKQLGSDNYNLEGLDTLLEARGYGLTAPDAADRYTGFFKEGTRRPKTWRDMEVFNAALNKRIRGRDAMQMADVFAGWDIKDPGMRNIFSESFDEAINHSMSRDLMALGKSNKLGAGFRWRERFPLSEKLSMSDLRKRATRNYVAMEEGGAQPMSGLNVELMNDYANEVERLYSEKLGLSVQQRSAQNAAQKRTRASMEARRRKGLAAKPYQGPRGPTNDSPFSAYAKGGWVKGSGNRDNIPAFLTPGEYVVSKPMIRDLTSRKAGAAAPTTHVTHEQNINVDVTNPTGKAIIDALKPVLFGLRHQP